MPIVVIREDDLCLVRMKMPRGNAISGAFVAEFGAALDAAGASGARAMVLTGSGRIFSTGLDLVEAFDLDRAGLDAFARGFDALFARLFALPMPVVAAVNGHAIAGGCILACAADYRVLAAGAFQVGVTEAQVGLSFPAAAMEVVRHAVPAASWTEVFLEGRRFGPDDAQKHGLVQRVAGGRGAWDEALDKARELARVDPAAARAIKEDLKRPTLALVERERERMHARFVEAWWSPATRATMARIREGLLRKG